MGGVRRNRRFGSWLALAGLALQIVVSFGHVHLHDIRPAMSLAAFAGPHAQAANQLPAPQPLTDDDDGYCAICASIYLVASSFVPAAPELPVPFGEHRVEHVFAVTADVAEPRRVAFRSRGPPALS